MDRYLPSLEEIGLGDAPPNVSPLSLESLQKVETVKRWLEAAGRLLGVGRASLFVRDSSDGRYLPLLEPDERTKDCFYLPGKGEGCTGHVIQDQCSLLVQDCGDEQELQQKGIDRVKYPKFWNREVYKLAYLAVPIFVGEDVLGVLRFLCWTPRGALAQGQKSQFSKHDQKLAEAAAERLARLLHKLRQQRDDQIWRALPSLILQAKDRQQLCQILHRALASRIGPCRCLVRLRDKRERTDREEPEEVLDRWFVSDESETLWPPYRTSEDPDSGLVWRDRRTRTIADVPTERQQRIDKGERVEPWMFQVGCAVIAPMNVNRELVYVLEQIEQIRDKPIPEQWRASRGEELVGILAMVRDKPGILLPSDIKFVERVAELAGPAFVKLAKTEEYHIQDSLNCALINYFFNRLKKMPPPEASAQLLLEINTALTLGVGGAVGYVWRVEDAAGKLLRGLKPTDAPAPKDVSLAALHQELGDRHFLVVSDIDAGPGGDTRLKCLLDALPNKQGARYQHCQRACILLDHTKNLRILHPALFFLVVLPPQRLSYERVDHLFRKLVTKFLYHGNRPTPP